MKFWRTPLDADRMVSPRGRLHIIVDRCKGCGFCIEFCPRKVLKVSEEFNSRGYHPPEVVEDAECINCGLCSLICPELAIYTTRVEEDHAE